MLHRGWMPRGALGAALVLTLAAQAPAVQDGASAAALAGEGALRNRTPLPTHEEAEAALERGDEAWAAAGASAPADRPSLQTRAFDAWRAAIAATEAGDGVRMLPGGTPEATAAALFPAPDGTHPRRSEDPTVAVLRRLSALEADERARWTDRFEGAATAALRRERTRRRPSVEGLGGVERSFPATRSAARAALAVADLELERARPSSSAVWIARARSHVALAAAAWTSEELAAFERALGRRQRVAQTAIRSRFVGDHTAPQLRPRRTTGADEPELRPVFGPARISGLLRAPEEPFGRGLGSGIAFYEEGSALVQGAYGVMLLDPSGLSGTRTRRNLGYAELLDINRPLVRAAASTGGWISRPASDGKRVALVVGRAERRRPFLDIEVPPAGNALALVERGAGERALEPLWVLRDGIRVVRPGPGANGLLPRSRSEIEIDARIPRAGSGAGGGLVEGWTLGRGWEIQPGPVLLDDTLFVLARGLGDTTVEGDDHADEVRLIAFGATNCEVRWSREVTSERGLTDPAARGRAGYFASTTMPMTVERSTGHLLVGTNCGLLCAYDVADGRLAWAIRNQRRRVEDAGWPGSRAPILSGRVPGRPSPTAWFAPFDSEFAYALPAGPAPLDGRLLDEPPRARRGALEIAAVLPPARAEDRAQLVLLGRDGRHAAVLLEDDEGTRRPASYLGPDERFAGRPALVGDRLFLAGTRELGVLSLDADLRLVDATSIPTLGAGRGGDVVFFRNRIHVVGRDTLWVWARP
ncbi:MAG: hypothetical protein AAGB93_12630 [Planctomycetota bacterium]